MFLTSPPPLASRSPRSNVVGSQYQRKKMKICCIIFAMNSNCCSRGKWFSGPCSQRWWPTPSTSDQTCTSVSSLWNCLANTPSGRLLAASSTSNTITSERLLGILRLHRGAGGSSSRGRRSESVGWDDMTGVLSISWLSIQELQTMTIGKVILLS